MRHIFVFGSNLAGRHGAGAALFAVKHYGAEYGVGCGFTGSAYALPTKDANLRTLPLDEIEAGYATLGGIIRTHPATHQWLLTPAGAGLAGVPLETVNAWRLKHIGNPLNVWLTGEWF